MSMDDLFLILAILGFLGVPICFIVAIINFFRKRKVKLLFISCGISFLLAVVGFIGFGITYTEVSKEENVQKFSEDNETTKTTQIITVPAETKVVETSTTPETTVEPETTVAETTSITPSDKDIFVEKLLENPAVSESAANETYDILTGALGFQKISVESNSMGTLFKIIADGFTLKVTLSDKPYMIICGDYNMYKDDTVQYTKQDLDDRVIGNNDTSYYVIAQEIIKSTLKNPSGAKFSSLSNCQMARNKELVAVKGYVDATNSFGAQIRSEFVVEFKVIDLTTFSYETIYINIDGESIGEYIDLK